MTHPIHEHLRRQVRRRIATILKVIDVKNPKELVDHVLKEARLEGLEEAGIGVIIGIRDRSDRKFDFFIHHVPKKTNG